MLSPLQVEVVSGPRQSDPTGFGVVARVALRAGEAIVDRSVIYHQGTAPGHLEQARARLLSPPFARPAAFF